MSRAPALGAALLALAGSGCSLLPRPAAEQTYFLRAVPAAEAHAAASPAVPLKAALRVMHPSAAPGLDSPRIVLLESQHKMGFYARSHWPAALPDLVESLTVETLRGSSAWLAVGDSGSTFSADYGLQITIRRFEADYGPSPAAPSVIPQVHVVLECLLGRSDGRGVVASFVAEGSATPAANRLSDVVAAFQAASSAALKSLSEHAATAVRADAPAPR